MVPENVVYGVLVEGITDIKNYVTLYSFVTKIKGFECRLLATGKEYQRYIDCQRLGKSTCLVVCMIPLARDLLQTTEEIKGL